MSKDLTPLFELYERLFNFFNEKYYNNELPMPVFVTDATYKDTNKTNFVKYKIWSIDSDTRYEMGINTDYLDCPIEEKICSLLHQMAHYYNLLKGISDTCKKGKYHNKYFLKTILGRGLEVEKKDCFGYRNTTLSEGAKELIKKHFKEEDNVNIKRDRPLKEHKEKKQKKYKYKCLNCKCRISLDIKANPHCDVCKEYLVQMNVKVNKNK